MTNPPPAREGLPGLAAVRAGHVERCEDGVAA